jgi:hypothetical protein
MGYFSNGTEGMDYEAAYCSRCEHYDEDGFCPVLDIHALYNYDQFKPQNIDIEDILNRLVPRSADKLSNDQCCMFIDAATYRDKRQRKLELEGK